MSTKTGFFLVGGLAVLVGTWALGELGGRRHEDRRVRGREVSGLSEYRGGVTDRGGMTAGDQRRVEEGGESLTEDEAVYNGDLSYEGGYEEYYFSEDDRFHYDDLSGRGEDDRRRFQGRAPLPDGRDLFQDYPFRDDGVSGWGYRDGDFRQFQDWTQDQYGRFPQGIYESRDGTGSLTGQDTRRGDWYRSRDDYSLWYEDRARRQSPNRSPQGSYDGWTGGWNEGRDWRGGSQTYRGRGGESLLYEDRTWSPPGESRREPGGHWEIWEPSQEPDQQQPSERSEDLTGDRRRFDESRPRSGRTLQGRPRSAGGDEESR